MTIEFHNVELQAIQPDGTFEDLLGQPKGMDLLPRRGDTINVDSDYFEVIGVEYTYKDQVNPTVYLKHVGDHPKFVLGLSDV
jgi:hypothetical protein